MVESLNEIAADFDVLGLIFALPNPLSPAQLGLVNGLTIGFPSFVLALQPNKNIVRGNFTYNIITRAAPAAICIALNIIVTALLSDPLGLSHAELSTMAVYTTSLIGLMLIVRLCIPFNALRGAMLALSTAGIIIATIFFRDFFKLTALSQSALIMQVITAVVIIVLFNLLYHFADKMIEKHKRESSPKTTT